jgi:hypothetical protein
MTSIVISLLSFGAKKVAESPEGMPLAKRSRNLPKAWLRQKRVIFFLLYDRHRRDVQLNVPTNFTESLSLLGMALLSISRLP